MEIVTSSPTFISASASGPEVAEFVLGRVQGASPGTLILNYDRNEAYGESRELPFELGKRYVIRFTEI